MSFNTKVGEALRNVVESKGEEGAVQIVREALKSGKMKPEDFTLKELWFASEGERPVHEALTSSMFPKLTGELINAKMIEGYNSIPTIGDMLVKTIKSNVQRDTFAGITDGEEPMEVGEGQEYSDSTRTEKYVTVTNMKFGRTLSITEEAIYFDKTGHILMGASDIGIKARQYKEKLVLEGVQDVNGTVYQPSGVPATLYAAGHLNLITTNPFGEAGLEAVLKQAQTMKSDAVGGTADDFIMINLDGAPLLVPVDLVVEASQMQTSNLTPESNENADNYFKGRFKTLTSPYVTQQSATTWFWGEFNKQFIWSEVWPLQTLTQRPGHDDEFKKDIKSRHKVRFFGNVAALDYRYVFKCTA